ncbi:hypothetical protein FKG94_27340 [Exilibacterium tricleocarpae]|uniref:Uncharacterized protein n=1 Tax=Exilibacterium tricleocarpae TaxID=2591008 RepID=A0A545SMW5_9GAMM|nr:hypothetical protein [Exilibacterium tricleocarpae]TQV66309.1 hypothetical protein FKG94_27340 [Exilibacterium tricleocarpae]
MRHSVISIFTFFLTICLPLLGLALENDQLRGEIIGMDQSRQQLQVRVLEAGDQMASRVDTIETFRLSRDTEIEYELDSYVYGPYFYGEPDFGDLNIGDTVILDFDIAAREKPARKIRNQKTRNQGLADRVRQSNRNPTPAENRVVMAGAGRDRLPDSASLLPAAACVGGLFVLLGLGLRSRRRSAA